MKTMQEIEEKANEYALKIFPESEDGDIVSSLRAYNNRELIKLGYMRAYNDMDSEPVMEIPFIQNQFKS